MRFPYRNIKMGREENEAVHVRWFSSVNSVIFLHKDCHVLISKISLLLMKYSIKAKS